MMSDVKKELAWSYVKEVREICQPLFDTLNINYFDYSRFYPDNKAFGLFTDPDYVNFFRNHETYKSGPKNILLPGKHLWLSYIDAQFLSEAREYFHHDHGLTILTEYPQYHEVCNFATSTQNKKILDIYLNNTDFIHRFIGYFKDKANHIIRRCLERPVIVASETEPKQIHDDQLDQVMHELFLNRTYHADLAGQLLKVSQREAQCISGILKGKTNKVIASELGLSPRTIEAHLDRVKDKMQACSKIELIKKIHNQDIILNWE